MGLNTAIAWTDHSFNPWMGCTKVSPACDHCYAEALMKRTGRARWGDDEPRVVTSDAYWRNPAKWNAAAEKEGRRHRVFCASLADVFEDRSDLREPRARLWNVIAETPWLDWQLLTKRPENVLSMVPWSWRVGQHSSPPHTEDPANWPSNVWIGTTVEDQQRADERIPHLLAIPAPVRFVSCEPLLGPVDLGLGVDHRGHERDHIISDVGWDCLDCSTEDETVRWTYPDGPRVDWVIVGGESGPGHRRLDLDHARSLRDQCIESGVPFFFKQVGGQFPTSGGDQLDGETIKQFPDRVPA